MIARSSYEQFGKCLNSGNNEDPTVGAKIAELLRLNASASEHEQLSLKEYVDRIRRASSTGTEILSTPLMCQL